MIEYMPESEVINMKFLYKHIKKVLLISIGTFLLALSTNAILIPHQLLSGGVSGIAMFLYFILNWNISITILLINIPLFVLAFIFLKKRFIIFSLIGMLFLTLWLEVTQGWVIPIENPISIPLLAGVISGLGVGIIFRADGSTAGIDIIAKIANQYLSINMATGSFVVNFIIVLLSVFYFSIDLAVLTVATMYVSTKATNFVVDGLNIRRTVFIITSQEHAGHMADDILKKLGRGVTVIPAIGGYTHEPKYILYTTVGIRELAEVKSITLFHDPLAFMTVNETAQVIGNGRGFLDMREEV